MVFYPLIHVTNGQTHLKNFAVQTHLKNFAVGLTILGHYALGQKYIALLPGG